MLSEIIWDPDRNIFVIPYINHAVTWYGFLFALGFFIGFFLIRRMFIDFLTGSQHDFSEPYDESTIRMVAMQLTDRLAVFVVVGGIIGARLGHVFFYEWSYYKANPVSILKVWEGGLASHGGALGVFIALLLFVFFTQRKTPSLSFLVVLDALVVPVAFAAGCIRIGNFINQEITGIPTNVPWGVIFVHPLDGLPGIAVHPVQLYESLFYFCVFSLLFWLWKKKGTLLGEGMLSGWFFSLVFGFRFFIDFLKMPQNVIFDEKSWLAVGQWLSIPFILLGILLLLRSYYCVRKKC